MNKRNRAVERLTEDEEEGEEDIATAGIDVSRK
jgi:hypothetical protein